MRSALLTLACILFSCGQGTAAFSLVNHAGGSLGANGGTTASITTTGANLLVASVTYDATSTITVSDSKSNTWTALTATTTAGGNIIVRMFYVAAPTVGTGHTFTVTGSGSAAWGEFVAFSGAAASPFDQQSGFASPTGSGTVTSVSPGSFTPGGGTADYLIVSGVGGDALGAPTPSVTGMTLLDATQLIGGTSWGGGAGYQIQSSAAPINPVWTTPSGRPVAVMASFRGLGSASVSVRHKVIQQ